MSACTMRETLTECPEELRSTGNGFIRALAADSTGKAYDYLLGDTVLSARQLDSLSQIMQDKKMGKLKLANYFEAPPREGDTMSAQIHYMLYECELEKGYMYYQLFLFETEGANKIGLVQVDLHPLTLKEMHRFTLEGKQAGHYLFLILGILVPLFILFTVYRIFRSPVRRRWLWAAGSLIGLASVNMVWSTGLVYFQLQSIVPLGIMAMRYSEYSPWNLVVGIPVVAIIFWIRELTGRNVAPVEKPEGAEAKTETRQKETARVNEKNPDPWSE
jgi:hypothetical protein